MQWLEAKPVKTNADKGKYKICNIPTGGRLALSYPRVLTEKSSLETNSVCLSPFTLEIWIEL